MSTIHASLVFLFPYFKRLGATTKVVLGMVVVAMVLTACTAGDPQFTDETLAGFWIGLWHGFIAWVTLVISIFSDQVKVYEPHNTGAWYDFGFLLGIACMSGGGSHTYHRKSSKSKSKIDQHEWEKIAQKVEQKFKRKIREWASAEPDEDWEVVGMKAEEKLKRKLREWAEKPEKNTSSP